MRLVQITDQHLTTDGEPYQGIDTEGRWLSALKKAAKLNADCLLLTGDFCSRYPEAEVYERVREQLDEAGLPYLILAGNHDDRAMLRDHFDLPGLDCDPIHYLHSIGGRDLIALDSSLHKIDVEQLDWLEQVLPGSTAPVVLVHHPPCLMGSAFMDRNYPLQNGTDLMRILQGDGRVIPVFCGHYHYGLRVQVGRVQVFCAAPTSFYIEPDGEQIQFLDRPAHVQVIDLRSDGLRVRLERV